METTTICPGSVTWGTNARGRCAVFCSHCRIVFRRDLSPVEARYVSRIAEGRHLVGEDIDLIGCRAVVMTTLDSFAVGSIVGKSDDADGVTRWLVALEEGEDVGKTVDIPIEWVLEIRQEAHQ